MTKACGCRTNSTRRPRTRWTRNNSARHDRDYHFLLTLSDHVAHFGLEHHESDDSRIGERSLLTPLGRRSMGGLLSHEFVHSSNGKFRRPAGLSTR
ncbi:MAG: hypothetical protein LAP13_23215, partial [Acidobacteriia bacterium]|nr:hypothetical protein [Terriglobia bacterium]